MTRRAFSVASSARWQPPPSRLAEHPGCARGPFCESAPETAERHERPLGSNLAVSGRGWERLKSARPCRWPWRQRRTARHPTRQMASLLDGAPAHGRLLTHRPVWALAGGELTGKTVNLTEQAAIRGHVSAGLDMVLSGHLHDFANYSFGPERPAQLIVGTGGDALLDLASTPIVGTAIDGIPIEKGLALK